MSYLELAKQIRDARHAEGVKPAPAPPVPKASPQIATTPKVEDYVTKEERELITFFLANPDLPPAPFPLRQGETVTNTEVFRASLIRRVADLERRKRFSELDDIFDVLRLVKGIIEVHQAQAQSPQDGEHHDNDNDRNATK